MYIAIEGCLGVGKTTVAKGLAAIRKSELLLEKFEDNPFLREFYENPAENAVETEFAFLLLHFHQLKSFGNTASESEVISDFHLGKDLLYADLNLKERRARQLFGEVYEYFLQHTPSPALIVFLSAPTELLIQRIRTRKRDFELEIDLGYYAAINAAYEDFFERYSGKKLRVPMDRWDFVKSPALYKQLASLVDAESDTMKIK
jgi:deoxyguanosine kinase